MNEMFQSAAGNTLGTIESTLGRPITSTEIHKAEAQLEQLGIYRLFCLEIRGLLAQLIDPTLGLFKDARFKDIRGLLKFVMDQMDNAVQTRMENLSQRAFNAFVDAMCKLYTPKLWVIEGLYLQNADGSHQNPPGVVTALFLALQHKTSTVVTVNVVDDWLASIGQNNVSAFLAGLRNQCQLIQMLTMVRKIQGEEAFEQFRDALPFIGKGIMAGASVVTQAREVAEPSVKGKEPATTDVEPE